MKLIYIANLRLPTEKAHGFQTMKMCEAFSKSKTKNQKLKVELLVPWRFNHIKKDPFDYYGIKKNFRIKKLPCIDLIPLDFILKNLALWIQVVSFLIFVRAYLMFKKYDILYTREQFAGLFFKNFVLEIHSLSKRIKPFHKKIWKKSKRLIVLTSFIKKRLIEVGVPENKILVAPDGIDVEKFDIEESKELCRKKFNLPLDKKIVLYTGHLYSWKGTDILLRAFQLLDSDTLLILVGGTKPDLKAHKSKIKKLKLDNILLIGHRPHKEIPYWLKSADCLVLSGTAREEISKYFTSPLKMFEYMASKRPVVAMDLPSFREVLNQNNSILVGSDNPNALAEGVKKILKNSNFSAKISKQAYKDVQKYTWDKRTKKILRFIIS